MKRIAIHSVPRSGSTWLGNIFNSHPRVAFSYQPLFSYAFKGQLTPVSTKEEIIQFFEAIYDSDDSFINQTEGIERGIIPNFSKNEPSHICYKEVRYHHILDNLLKQDSEIKVIGLVRNPFAVINSWLRAPKEFKKELGWKVEEEWRCAPKKNLGKPEEFNGFEKWKEVTLLFIEFQKQYPEGFYLLLYDDLLLDIKKTMSSLFTFCNLNVPESTQQFIASSRKKNDSDAYSVYKKKLNDDSWKKELPTFIIDEIKKDSVFLKLNEQFKWIK